MNLCIKIPTKLKFKRFNKKYAKLKYIIDHKTSNILIQDSPQFVCGLKALSHGILTSKLLNSSILLLRRAVGKGRVGWPRVRITFNLKVPVTKKSEGHRMGKGKGPVRFWSVPIKAGSFVFKIHKSPRKMFAFQTFDWTHIFSFFELLNTISSIYDNRFSLNTTYRSSTSVLMSNFLNFTFSFKFKLILLSFLYKFRFNFFFFKKVFAKKNQTLSWFILKFKNVFFLKNKNNTKLFVDFFRFEFFLRLFILFLVFCINSKIAKFQIAKNKTNRFNVLYKQFYSKRIRQFYSIFFFSGRRFFFLKRKNLTENTIPLSTKVNLNLHSVSYVDNTILAERTQRFSETKISYMPSLFRGLRRIKKKMPFSSEFFFVDERNCGYSFYSSMKNKKTLLKQRNQR